MNIQLNCGNTLRLFSTHTDKCLKKELSKNNKPVMIFEMIIKSLNQLLLRNLAQKIDCGKLS